MDSQTKKPRPEQTQDIPAQPATIVRNIGEIERGYFEACGSMSAQFMTAVAEVMRKAAPTDWQVVGNEEMVSLTVPEWRSTRGMGRGDAWLEIAEVANDDEEHSWIAAATRSGETSMALELRTRNGLPKFPDVLAHKSGVSALLMERGFEYADAGERMFVPITIDKEALALAFDKGDFAEALVPVRQAVELVVAAKGDLDGLIALLRQRGKG